MVKLWPVKYSIQWRSWDLSYQKKKCQIVPVSVDFIPVKNIKFHIVTVNRDYTFWKNVKIVLGSWDLPSIPNNLKKKKRFWLWKWIQNHLFFLSRNYCMTVLSSVSFNLSFQIYKFVRKNCHYMSECIEPLFSECGTFHHDR